MVGGTVARSLGLKREQRLRRRSDFSTLYSSSRSWTNRLLVLRARPNGLDVSRFGFVASKRLGNAVARNRVRRRVREAVRVQDLKPGMDIVFIARVPAAEADYWSIKEAAVDLLIRARLHRP
ncbi:MAG: rnpA [Dehalococcoidia bacterium]|nr:rnpA [Dehalococcoidia bacterium]